ncbi:hypothetical protein N8655_00175 [bacterium]|nr:hypothetical protein [bacterium]
MKMFKTLIVMVSLAPVAFAQQAEGPRELKVLTSQYERAVEKAVEPLTAKYLAALEKLKSKFTKEQKLEQALAVDAVIKKLASANKLSGPPRIGHPKDAAELKLYLAQDTWTHDGGKSVWSFYEDGTFGLGNKKGNRFIATDKNTLTMIWGGKGTKGINCQFSDDFSKFSELQGAKATYRLIKK